MPTSPEGTEARQSMTSRLDGAETARDCIVEEAVRAAWVFRGAVARSMARVCRRRSRRGWTRLWSTSSRASGGQSSGMENRGQANPRRDGHPVQRSGLDEAAADHPVAKGVLSEIGKFPPTATFGWARTSISLMTSPPAPSRRGAARSTPYRNAKAGRWQKRPSGSDVAIVAPTGACLSSAAH